MAHAAPDPAAELVAELIDRARDGSLDPAWIEGHVRPGAQAWSRSSRDAWTRALADGSPLRLALARASGIVDVTRGQGATRVIVEGVPPLAIVVDESASVLRSIEPTSCTACDPKLRFVSDLLADVRRRATVFPRLRPGLELDVSRTVGSDKQFDASWSASLDAYLGSDEGVIKALSSAVVVGQEGDVVQVRYPDGRGDTWRIGWTTDGLAGRIAYDGLAPDSPLRLEGDAVLPWRPDGFQTSEGDVAWRPVARLRGDGSGRQVGRAAAAATLDPHGDTALVLALEPDQRLSAVFRVVPETGEVLERKAGPALPDEVALSGGSYPGRAQLAVDPAGGKVAFTLPDGLHVLDLATEQSQHVTIGEPVAYVGFGRGGKLVVGTTHGQVLVEGEVKAPSGGARVLAVHEEDGRTEVVDTSGAVVWRNAAGAVVGRSLTCDGDAIAAARRPRDGTWLVACGPSAPWSHALALPLHGGVHPFAGQGAASGAVAWSPDGEHYVVPAPGGGSVLWDDHADRAEAPFGRTPLRAIAFSTDGDDLLGSTIDGDVVWWDVPTVRKLNWIVRGEAARP